MQLTESDINKLSKLILIHVNQVTCNECCKYYLVPMTAPCGHSLCNGCWTGRKICATCKATVSRKSLKQNLHLQKMTTDTQALKECFECIFDIDFDEFLNETTNEINKNPIKNVEDWLANSENQFSAPDTSLQYSTQNSNNQQKETISTVQIHKEMSKPKSTKSIVHVGVPQEDWDKIEEMPDKELPINNKENVIGPMDIEPFELDAVDENTADRPRRSSRKRNNKGDTDSNISLEHTTTKDSKKETDSKLTKLNWGNVKRMKKEFSKFNKASKNKLNVSIEQCKKTLITANKNIPINTVSNFEKQLSNIEDNTPYTESQKDCISLTRNMETDHLSKNNLFKEVNTAKMHDKMLHKNQINECVQRIDNQNVENNQLDNTSNISPPSEANKDQMPVAFIIKGALQTPRIEKTNDSYVNNNNNNNHQTIVVNTDSVEHTQNSEDIEITIKIGNTITNICIKKKEHDVKLKINTDKEIQTSLQTCSGNEKNITSCSEAKELEPENNVVLNVQNIDQKSQQIVKLTSNNKALSSNKTPSSKKNTESADTATAQYEITESIEKELSKEMEKAKSTQSKSETIKKTNKHAVFNDVPDEDCLNDLDLFDIDSVKEGNVHSLKPAGHAPSEILISTLKSNRSKKQIDKRIRDATPNDLPCSKKMKLITEDNEIEEIGDTSEKIPSKNFDQDSELQTYDHVMGKVFANIDLDLAKENEERNVNNNNKSIEIDENIVTPLNSKARQDPCHIAHGHSENLFSLLEKDSEVIDQITSLKTQRTVNQKAHKVADIIDVIDEEICTPILDKDNDDNSDRSIVEDTPQKDASFQKVKQKSGGSINAEKNIKNKSLRLKRPETVHSIQKSNSPDISTIDITTITDEARKDTTVFEAPNFRPTLDTPLTINNFVDQIKHKSTPMARKSLNFNNENTENSYIDPEQTLCPSILEAAKTTQEKEFLCQAFENSPITRAKSPFLMRQKLKTKKYCVAASCLTPFEITNVKNLCALRNWDYVDKYTKDVTHLVVGVDEENKSQRSVKYVCALAGSKWIVSYAWVLNCLQKKTVVDEQPFEALDSSGEAGPQRSRLARQKLFHGITFYCMPPFTILDVDTLKDMLEAAGGRVVGNADAVQVTGDSDSVALLLAEPKDTQEDRFTYLAMKLSIVPVNSEWVLNCLGSYTLRSILELLLCPESILPAATAKWPQYLMAKDFDSIETE